MKVNNQIDFVKYYSVNGGHGNGLIIKGGVRKGKTTLISLITRILLEESKFIVISNVRFHNSVYDKYEGKLFYINSLRQYLNYYANIPYENPILLVWDDAQASEGMTSKDVMSKSGKMLAQFLIFIGKMQTSYLYVAHQKYIPSPLIDGFEPLIIYKNNRTQFVLSSEIYDSDKMANRDKDNWIINLPKPITNQLENGNTVISNEDKNYLPIMSIAFTTFNFNDVDLKELNEKLTVFEVGENIKETVRDYLDNNINENGNAEYINLKKLSYEKIYIALCLKKGKVLSSGETIRDLINPNILNETRKKLKKIGFN